MSNEDSFSLINTSSFEDQFGLLTNISSSWEVVDLTEVTIKILCGQSNKDRDKCIESIEKAPENYSPLVFFVLAAILYKQRRPFEQTGFWLFFGELRAQFDAGKCKDSSVYGSVSTLRSEICGGVFEEVFKQSVTTLETIMNRVIQADEHIAHNYNPYWINLYGLSASLARLDGNILDEKDLSVPVKEWDRIAQETRITFREMIEHLIEQIGENRSNSNNASCSIL